jgi:hypothetical protein
MKSFERAGQSVTVREGGRESKELQEIPADEVGF